MAIINGTSNSDNLVGTLDNDQIAGLIGNDVISGLEGNDGINGNQGEDRINGNRGADIIYGGKDEDIIRGGKGDDIISGDDGNDVLYGDNGNNTLTGGSDRDLFVLGDGTSLITDFTNGQDLLGLTGGLSFTALTLIQGNGETLVQANGVTLARLQGISASQISAEDFTTNLNPIATPTPTPTPPTPSPVPTPTPTRPPIPVPTPTPTPTPTPPAYTLQILHAADQEAGLPAIQDAVNFSAVLNALEDDFANTVKLTSGDVYIPGPFLQASDEVYGEPGIGDILINNALGFQAAAFGNHEFDLGTGVVKTLIEANPDITGPGIDAGGYAGTAFPYLSTNLNFAPDQNLADLVVPDGQAPQPNSISGSVVLEEGGERIGVVGATTPTLPNLTASGNVEVLPPNPNDIAALAAEIQTAVDALTAQGINKIVLLAHMQQIAIERQLAELLQDVDVIIAGGSNTRLANADDLLRPGDEIEGPYPIELRSFGNDPVVVVNTDGNYKYVGRLALEFDENGIITNILDESGAYATDEAGVDRVYGTDVNPEEVANPIVVEVTNAIADVVLEKDANLFGRTEVFLEGRRGEVRRQETNLGNLTADANLFVAQQYDPTTVVSIKNGGGIRDNIGTAIVPAGGTGDPILSPPPANPLANKEEGEISQLDIENALRFNNQLSLITVTAAELKQIIEYAVSATAPGATPGQFPQVGGIAFSFDPTADAIALTRDAGGTATGVATEGERVQSLAILAEDGTVADVIAENGEIVGDPNREVRVVTLNFLAGGGDGYPFPLFGEDRVDLVEEPLPQNATNVAEFAQPGTEQDALAEYLAAAFPADDDANTPIFTIEDVDPEADTRIQNLEFREDTVLNNANPTPNPINSGPGGEQLLGTPAADAFTYTDLVQAGDTIDSFDPTADRFRISVAGFGGGLTPGVLNAGAFVSGANPVATVDTRFLYNTTTGVLSFDPDGTGMTAPTVLATLTGIPDIGASLFTLF